MIEAPPEAHLIEPYPRHKDSAGFRGAPSISHRFYLFDLEDTALGAGAGLFSFGHVKQGGSPAPRTL